MRLPRYAGAPNNILSVRQKVSFGGEGLDIIVADGGGHVVAAISLSAAYAVALQRQNVASGITVRMVSVRYRFK